MRLPPSVRYFPSRLQVILNPWLLLAILVTGVVGVYAWEYRQNPGQLPWKLGNTGLGSSGDATSTDVLLESLTPEEQAVAAELDNIDLLLAQLDSDVSALTAGGDSSAAASLNAATNDASGASTESGVERLIRYVDEYSFLGTRARGANVQGERNEATVIPAQRPAATSALNSQPETAAELPTSALSEALSRQLAEQEELSEPEIAPTNGADSRGLPVDASTEPQAEAAEVPSEFSFNQAEIVPGSLDGLNRSFIRTTPNMSPPPGTTGYVPPASLNPFGDVNQSSNGTPFQATQPADDFGRPSSLAIPDRSGVLPSIENSTRNSSELPTLEAAPQSVQNQPRNAWESFWE